MESPSGLDLHPDPPPTARISKKVGVAVLGVVIFVGVLVVGIAYIGWSLSRDLVNLHVTSVLPYFLLGLALFVARWDLNS